MFDLNQNNSFPTWRNTCFQKSDLRSILFFLRLFPKLRPSLALVQKTWVLIWPSHYALSHQECQIEFSSSEAMLYSISIMHMKVLSQLNHLHEPARYWWITVQLFVTKAHTFSFKSWLMWKSWLEQIISSTEYRPTERSVRVSRLKNVLR